MENSFFYFFSATPQALAAILALFGFFLVFKLQSLKEEMLTKAADLKEYLSRCERYFENDEKLMHIRHSIFLTLTAKLPYKNILEIYQIILIDSEYIVLND